jgi:ATP-dependent DNA helicase DinG
MLLADAVRATFDHDGALANAFENFLARPAQIDMAVAIAETVEQGGALVVEAGTGVGKTFAYLVPALLSGERVLLSTATKNLQDQLFGRDLPKLVQALGLPTQAALLKGRGSYLCLHRMVMARQDPGLDARTTLHALAKVEEWSQVTRTGDLAELPGLDERSALVPLITSTRDNCLGTACPKHRACHVNLARREAMAADVVVVNHHLFFADLAVRESGVAELLPSVKVAVFDEAHQLNEIGVQFLGAQVSTAAVIDLAKDMLGTGLQLARGLADWQTCAAGLERSARDLRLAAPGPAAGARIRWTDPVPDGVDPEPWLAALNALIVACQASAEALDTVLEIAPDFGRLNERVQTLQSRLDRFMQPAAPEAVRWLDAGSQLRLIESPLDIADAVRAKVLGERRLPTQPDDGTAPAVDASAPSGRSWIFTSATLGDESGLSWFTEPCGLSSARQLRVGSPFDYAHQAAVFVPRHLPRPNDPTHSASVAALAGDAAAKLGGRTMLLTTTLRAMRAIGGVLHQRFDGSAVLEVLVQGEMPKRRLIERFREGASAGRPGCILVAAASFWEGVDVPGDALQLVVIDKLPFPPPNDPLVEARSSRLEGQGRSAFADYTLPEAAVSLKQGAGRLIRSETDLGALVVCDNRLVTMGYGRRLLAALPAMRKLTTDAEFQDWLDQLVTRASTTDCPWP